MKKAIKRTNFYYLIIVIMAIIFPLSTYPSIYGTDGFQLIWMANALREGALFSENTWLIHPISYFGMYPFSHRAIGVPMFLAFLTSLLNYFSMGRFGITEVILTFNIILIILTYKSSRNLGNRLFEEEWSRLVFITAILLSPNVIRETTMMVSTRLIITIIMIVLLNLNLGLLTQEKNYKIKTFFFMFLILLIGALAHRLWLITSIAIIFMIFTVFTLKYKLLQKLLNFLILPACIISFFVGLSFFYIDPRKIWSPFLDNSTLIGVSTNLGMHYLLQVGLILIFFPIGVIITLYKLTNFLKIDEEKREQPKNNNILFMRKNFYLILFIIPFSFMAPAFYAVVIFLPIIIIFSIYGLIYVKKFLIKTSKKFDRFFPIVILFLAVGYTFLYSQIIFRINLLYMFVLFPIAIIIYLVNFIVHKFSEKIKSKISFIYTNNYKFRRDSEVFVLLISILIFSTTTVVGRWRSVDTSPYPWENRYLTGEEKEIINFFQNEDIFGLIYTNVPLIAPRISGVGFLPIFRDKNLIGAALYYGFISPDEVHENTVFSLSGLSTLSFFTFNEPHPIRSFRNFIIHLNMSLEGDLNTLRSEYNVQYIITGIGTVLSIGASWTLIKSLPITFTPVFSTQHLLVWRIY